MSIAIVWFRGDLRLQDHHPLQEAIKKHAQVVPVYIFDVRRWRMLDLGFPKTGSLQTRFITEAVKDLKGKFQAKGSDLLTLVGFPEEILPELVVRYGVSGIFTSEEPAWEEARQLLAVRKALPRHIPVVTAWQYPFSSGGPIF